jgi:hypothetical protein
VSKKAPAPDGFERLLTLGDAVKAARASVAEKVAAIAAGEADLERERDALMKLRADLVKIERKFQELVLSAAHAYPDEPVGPSQPTNESPQPTTPKPTPKNKRTKSTELEPGLYFGDIPRKLRLAWHIIDEGVLDYELAAFAIYGTNDTKAKARVNALMTALRQEGLVTPSQGQRRYSLTIDRDELLQRSRAAARR